MPQNLINLAHFAAAQPLVVAMFVGVGALLLLGAASGNIFRDIPGRSFCRHVCRCK